MATNEASLTRSSLISVFTNAYILNALGRAADVVWLLLLFTVLSVEQVAFFSLASAAAAFFAMGLDAGINQTLLRAFSARSLSLRHGAFLALRVRTILFSIILLAGGTWWLVKKPTAEVATTVVVACAVQLWILAEQFCQQWLKANDRQTLANILATSDSFLKLVATCALTLGKRDATALDFFALQNIAHCILTIGCLIACANTSRYESAAQPASAATRSLLRASGWFAVMGLITVVQNRIDWLLIAKFADNAALASYSLVNRAYEVLMMLIGTGAMTLFPMLCRTSVVQRETALVATFRKAVLATGVLGAGVAAVLLPAFCNWMWGEKYPGAGALFGLLMPVACLSTFIQIMYYEAVSGGGEARLVALTIVSTLAQLAVNLTLVPLWGSQGAIAGMLTLALGNISFYFVLRAQLRLPSSATMSHLVVYAMTMAIVWLTITFTVPFLWAKLCIGTLIWSVFSYGWLLGGHERTALKRIAIVRLRLIAEGSGAQ